MRSRGLCGPTGVGWPTLVGDVAHEKDISPSGEARRVTSCPLMRKHKSVDVSASVNEVQQLREITPLSSSCMLLWGWMPAAPFGRMRPPPPFQGQPSSPGPIPHEHAAILHVLTADICLHQSPPFVPPPSPRPWLVCVPMLHWEGNQRCST